MELTNSKQRLCVSSCPPLDGSLFFPEMVEFNAKNNPTHPFYIFHDEHTGGLCHITHLEFYRACQRIAHVVRPSRQGPDNVVVGLLANCDTMLYQALTMGVMYAGLIPFPMSPRNSPAAVVNMMQKTGCRRLISTRHSLGALLDGIETELPGIQIEDPPTLAYAYPELGKETEGTLFVPYPAAGKCRLKDDILFYLHSSGSTGFPKPIPMTNLNTAHWCIMPSIHEHVYLPKHFTVCAASLPPFHTMGMFLQLFYPVASLKTVVVFPPTSYHDSITSPIVPNPQNTIDVIQSTRSNAVFVVPAFLEEWASSAQAIGVLCSLDYVAFGGGPLARKTGDKLVVAGVKLSSVYGGTEFGPLTYILRNPPEQHLWEWIQFGLGRDIRWASQGDGTYECQVLTSPTHQPSLENLPDVKGFATADVFIKHPSIEGFYKIVGRLDDVLIHSSGEKTVPAPMETVIGASHLLSGVCMFGRGRKQTGVLVEPRPECAIDVTDDKQVTEFRNKIWQEVEEANKEAPTFSRIFKEMILVTSKDKPMLRAGKGTVIKKATMALYGSEIDALYASAEASTRAGIEIPLPRNWSQSEVENWLIMHATGVNSGKLVEVDVDVFEQGFDSLSSTFLKNRIIGSLAASSSEEVQQVGSRISQNIVFSNPTLRLLASHLIQLVAGDAVSASDPREEIEDMIAKYSDGLGDQARDVAEEVALQRREIHDHVVLLTGSTGGLGSYLLASLLKRKDVAMVYALNRPSKSGTIQERQRAIFEDRGLDTTILDSAELIYVECDLSQPKLSLDDGTYDEIRDSVTIIIHNAWRLDFNLALSSFESNVRGTRNLIDLARGSKRALKPRFLFASSVASAQGWDRSNKPFPEEVQFDAGVAVGPGYGASKYVSERILAASDLPVVSFRIGQITGGEPRGAWSTTDWIPIVVKSSLALGAFPEARGLASWVPPQAVCDTILEIAFTDKELPFAMNILSPRPIRWRTIMTDIGEVLHQKSLTQSPLPLIPLFDWVEKLEKYAVNPSEEDVRRVPAIKLLEFMRALARRDATMAPAPSPSNPRTNADNFEAGSARFSIDVALRASEALRHLVVLTPVDVERWVSYWQSVGMFAE